MTILLILLALLTPAWAIDILQPDGSLISCREIPARHSAYIIRDETWCCQRTGIEVCAPTMGQAITAVKARQRTNITQDQTCQQRLSATLSEARRYIYAGQGEEPPLSPYGATCQRSSGHEMLPTTYHYLDKECEAQRKLEAVQREKALAATIDALLQECP